MCLHEGKNLPMSYWRVRSPFFVARFMKKHYYIIIIGGMAEWLKAAVLKTASQKWDVGSNPTPSVFLCPWF